MSKKLNQLNRERELRDPAKRAIIQLYTDAEIARLDEAVYSHLEKKYPSLQGILTEMKNGYNPVAKMEETRVSIQMLKTAGGLVGLVTLVENDEDTQSIQTMVDKINPVCELYGKFVPIQEQFYVDLANAVKRISAAKSISYDEAVRNLDYMDEVSRIVIPTRQEAEAFLRTLQSFEREMLDVARGFFAFAKKIGRTDEKVMAKTKLLPTAKATEVVQQAIWDYQMREFDRIYSA